MKNKIIDACFKIVKESKTGCLFVIEAEHINMFKTNFYKTSDAGELGRSRVGKYHDDELTHFNYFPLSIMRKTDLTVIKKLSELDGATIIDELGTVIEFGATLTHSDNFIGHGKRHAFALGTSKIPGLVCILKSDKSEGDGHVRLFRDGICEFDIDPKTKLPVKTQDKIIEIFSMPISQILIASGITLTIVPLALPALITFHGAKFLVSKGFEPLKKLFK